MIKLGLVGYPLGHSLSPGIHNAALKSNGLVGEYSLFPIPSDHKQDLKDLLQRVRDGEITGLNVTIPHKQNVIEWLDELTPTAQAIGAVNTIYMRDSKLIGGNTDAPGFLADLKKKFSFSSFNLPPSALVLGAGGSARAVVYALLNDGWDMTIAAKRMEQAEQLAASFIGHKLRLINYKFTEIGLSNITLLVNTTPVGMMPKTEQSPWPENLPFPPQAVIYDLVYNPQETKLVRKACLQGRPATTGLGMLIEQAALAFEIWMGVHPSRQVMMDSALQALPVTP